MKRKQLQIPTLNDDCWSVIRGFCSSTAALGQTCKTLHALVPQHTIRIHDHVGTVTSLKWLLSLGLKKADVCRHIAIEGHLEVLKWAREQGCPWGADTCANAAWGGHLELLKWVREAGCPWNESTCTRAAEYGHLEVLKWAREASSPCYKHT